MKKLLSVLLAVMLLLTVFTVLPLSASALTYGDFTYEVVGNGAVAITEYTGSATEVNIPTKIGDYWVVRIGDNAFEGNTRLERVTIQEGMVRIGQSAFKNCTSLRYVTLPQSLRTIWIDAFRSTAIRSIDLPHKLETVKDYAFFNCISLKNVSVPKSVTTIGERAFGFCFVDGAYTKDNEFALHGFRGTAAQEYAEKRGVTFVAKIEQVDISVTAPVPDAHPDYSGTKDTEECAFLTGDGFMAKLLAPHGTGVEFYDKEAEKLMDATDTFVAGKTYTVTVYLTSNSATGYEFGVDDEAPVILINGQIAEITPTSTLTIVRLEMVSGDPENTVLLGDVNLDSAVTNRDAVILDRYIAGWTGYGNEIKSRTAADLSRDNDVTNRDAVILDRYIANWTGYSAYIYFVTVIPE